MRRRVGVRVRDLLDDGVGRLLEGPALGGPLFRLLGDALVGCLALAKLDNLALEGLEPLAVSRTLGQLPVGQVLERRGPQPP